MAKYNCGSLDVFMERFLHLEQNITEINAKNNMLESKLEDANRLLKFYMAREKSLVEVENDRLKTDMAELKQQHEETVEAKDGELKKLLQMKDLDLQEMKERLNKQERERQSELLQLQLEKLHFFQEEKNREIVALRQRIRELEENQPGCSRLKRRRL